jgi:hypothetical protein
MLATPVVQDVRGVATGEGGGGTTHGSQGASCKKEDEDTRSKIGRRG